MSKTRLRDFYLSLADERPEGHPEPQLHEVAGAVLLARTCILGGIALASFIAFAVDAWVH